MSHEVLSQRTEESVTSSIIRCVGGRLFAMCMAKTDYNSGIWYVRNGQEAINLVKVPLFPYSIRPAYILLGEVRCIKQSKCELALAFRTQRMRARDKRQDTGAHKDLSSHTPYIKGLISWYLQSAVKSHAGENIPPLCKTGVAMV